MSDYYEYDADYPYFCQCGERYSNFRAAWLCRKCDAYIRDEDRNYTVSFERAPGVFDILRGSKGTKVGEWRDGEPPPNF